MRVRKRIVNGHEYYYLEESIRLEKARVFSLFLGKKIPGKGKLEEKKRELLEKIYGEMLASAGTLYLTKGQLIEAEKRKRRYGERIKRLGKARRDEKEEIDSVNFVYTTLSTEGVPVTREDAGLAYRFNKENVRNVRDENLRVALDMIKGLRFVKESPKGITVEFISRLHATIMAEYGERNPGIFRRSQAYIYLKSYDDPK
ncbi:Uncharacterised protein [uncultured archaeon]|nr:Uncharacterised protein [uncultured archaeon]